MKYVPPYGVTANPDAGYINGDPSIGRQGSIPPAAVFENPQREICNVISDSKQTPADTDLHQLTRGIRDGKLNFCVDSGPLNELQVVLPGPAVQAYTAGLTLHVLIAHTNTGPTRISVGTLNPTTVKRPNGSELQAHDLLAGMVAVLVCDGTYFQCINIGTGEVGAGDTNIYKIDIPYVNDTGVANHLIGLYSPPLDDIREGRTVEIKLAHNVTGPTDFKPNNFPIHPVARPDGSPIKMGDGVINQIWMLMFDGAQWQMVGSCCGATVPAEPASQGSGKSLQFNYGTWGVNGTNSVFRRTPAMNTNRQVWTVSFFLKRPDALVLPDITQPWSDGHDCECWFSAGEAGAGGDMTGLHYVGTPQGNTMNIHWNNASGIVSGAGTSPIGGGLWGYQTAGILMDTKWHHLLFNADGANVTMKIDGIMTNRGQATGSGPVNAARPHCIGHDATTGIDWYGSKIRMAEFVIIDGQCLDWDKFALNIGGIITPKTVTGLLFGPNGTYLNWQDSSAVTSTTLGKDYSGNGNNWTPYNFTTAQVLTDYPG